MSCSVALRCSGSAGLAVESATGPFNGPPNVPTALLAPLVKRLGAGGNKHRGGEVKRIVRTVHKRVFVAGVLAAGLVPTASSASTRWTPCADDHAATGYYAINIHARELPCSRARENAFYDIANPHFAKYARVRHHTINDSRYGRFRCTSSFRWSSAGNRYLHMLCASRDAAYWYDVAP